MKNALILSVAAFLGHSAFAADKVDFTKSIAPIFESRCIDCHGAEKQKADLRLDQKKAALDAELSAIVPGKPDKSLVLERVSLPPDHDDIMPPKGDPLTKEQIELIKQWINEGAAWPDDFTVGAGEKKAETAVAKEKKVEFSGLTPTKDPAAEKAAIDKLAELGISVRPIAQNLEWKEATVRPQDTNKVSEAVALLKDIHSLVDLNLGRLNLKDDDLKHISGLSNLQRLHLENNPITDAGVAHLKGLTNLEYINLYNTQVSDAGLENLKGMNNLAAVYLWQSKVTDEGAETLRKALPNARVNRGEGLQVAKVEEKKEEEKK